MSGRLSIRPRPDGPPPPRRSHQRMFVRIGIVVAAYVVFLALFAQDPGVWVALTIAGLFYLLVPVALIVVILAGIKYLRTK